MGRVDYGVGITCAVGLEPAAEIVGELNETLAGAGKPASPVEEVEEVSKPGKLEQSLARPRHRRPRLRRPALQRRRLETAFEMNVDFRLGQLAQGFKRDCAFEVLRHGRPPTLGSIDAL